MVKRYMKYIGVEDMDLSDIDPVTEISYSAIDDCFYFDKQLKFDYKEIRDTLANLEDIKKDVEMKIIKFKEILEKKNV